MKDRQYGEQQTFLTMVRFTPEGRGRLKDWPGIYGQLGDQLRQVGGDLVDGYGVLGEYDFCVVAKAPSHAAISQVWLAITGSGLVETHTHPLIPATVFNRQIAETREVAATGTGR